MNKITNRYSEMNKAKFGKLNQYEWS